MIDGLIIEPLKKISDERGTVFHMLRKDNPLFTQFGEIYFSSINPGFIKGWKKHFKITQNFAVPVGNIKLVVYDDRENSPTYRQIEEIFTGIENYQLVQIPPLVWYSFKAEGVSPALIANCIDAPYDSQESIDVGLEAKEVPFQWKS